MLESICIAEMIKKKKKEKGLQYESGAFLDRSRQEETFLQDVKLIKIPGYETHKHRKLEDDNQGVSLSDDGKQARDKNVAK